MPRAPASLDQSSTSLASAQHSHRLLLPNPTQAGLWASCLSRGGAFGRQPRADRTHRGSETGVCGELVTVGGCCSLLREAKAPRRARAQCAPLWSGPFGGTLGRLAGPPGPFGSEGAPGRALGRWNGLGRVREAAAEGGRGLRRLTAPRRRCLHLDERLDTNAPHPHNNCRPLRQGGGGGGGPGESSAWVGAGSTQPWRRPRRGRPRAPVAQRSAPAAAAAASE